MPSITLDLVRRKSEHNEGLIHTLEELTLHQEELEGINEVLNTNCRKLKILYLQNNVIPKMENLNHMKDLEYLNLALNNIVKVEGLGSCEFLNKLDLTVNFIDLDDLKASVDHLASRHCLRDLYMMGNPCQTNWPGFESYVVARVPSLERLDGKDITRSMRIKAQQQLPALEAEQEVLAEEVRQQKLQKAQEKQEAARPDAQGGGEGVRGDCLPEGVVTESQYDAAQAADDKDELTQHTPEARVKIYKEISEQKREKEERQKENMPRERDHEAEHAGAVQRARDREANGIIRQCNEGKLEFSFDEAEDRSAVILDVAVPKYLDSSLIDLDVHPHYCSVVIKGKVLRLTLPCEVDSGRSRAQRSKVTGHLMVTMPKVNPKETLGLTGPQQVQKVSTNSRTRTVRKTSSSDASLSLAAQMMAAAQDATPYSQSAEPSKVVSIQGIVPVRKGGVERDEPVQVLREVVTRAK